MASTKLGRQTPTQSVTLPYGQTDGPQAVALYEQTGRASMPWQQLLIYDILARDADGLWVHPKFGYSVPRRNGKNEVVTMREMYGLKNGETILHTAPPDHHQPRRLGTALLPAGQGGGVGGWASVQKGQIATFGRL